MIIRSFLFVPGDSEKKMSKVDGGPADALILDLEDSVAQERLPVARTMVCSFLQNHPDRKQQLWVRVNPLDSGLMLADLAAVMPGAPDGIVLPKVDSAAGADQLGHYLSALEVREGLEDGQTQILSVATETARSLFHLESYVGATARMYGLTWGAEDLSAALGASTNQAPTGGYADVYRLARALALAAGKAAEIEPVGSVFTDFRNSDGLYEEALDDRHSGFTGKIAIHPDQVPVINQAFTPSEEDIVYAKRVVQVFRDNPNLGTIGLDGKMLDKPHLTQAEKLLAMAASAKNRAS